MEITRNYFCGVFLKNHKYLARDVSETLSRRHGKDIFFETCLKGLKDVTQKTSFWDVIMTS